MKNSMTIIRNSLLRVLLVSVMLDSPYVLPLSRMSSRRSDLFEIDVAEERRRLAVVVLEADVALGGEVADLASRMGLPIEDRLAVEVDLEVHPLELDADVVPFPGCARRQDLGRLDVIGRPSVVDARRGVVDLDLDRVGDVVVAHGDLGDAEEDP